MKNIYIIGTPRTGKTTLVKMIKERFPVYSIISMEAVRNAFIKTQPSLLMNQRNSDARKNIFPVFIKEFLDWNANILNYPSIIEGSMIDIRDGKLTYTNDDIVFCLAHDCNNMYEVVSNIRKFDKETDYTNTWTDDQIFSHFGDICDLDLQNKIICERNNIMYFSTSKDRYRVLEDIVEVVEKMNT